MIGFFSFLFLAKRILTGIIWFGIIWFVFEFALLIYFFLQLIRSAYFFCTLCILTYFIAWHSNELTNVLVENIQLYKHKKVFICPNKVSLFFFNYNKICSFFIAKQIFPNVLLAFLASNIPINIYIIKGFVFDKEELLIRLVMLIIFAVQIVAFYITLNPLASVCSTLHSPHKMLVPLQYCLTGHKWLLNKLKIDDLVKRLLIGPKNAISIGPLREVTRQVLFEVRLYTFYYNFLFIGLLTLYNLCTGY